VINIPCISKSLVSYQTYYHDKNKHIPPSSTHVLQPSTNGADA